ncbi:RAD protein [Plasmodium ovale curtisi]|uniref:RAD protein n=1 Tax=Plasmodium ovale curtisi TaxID=864141 RepID=A0A1A8WSC1_PLAOA|nr:RAD protein [Plasmodium ovale curtisi]SBT00897.1 RAD protein [Plasmodium ovale curtisi]
MSKYINTKKILTKGTNRRRFLTNRFRLFSCTLFTFVLLNVLLLVLHICSVILCSPKGHAYSSESNTKSERCLSDFSIFMNDYPKVIDFNNHVNYNVPSHLSAMVPMDYKQMEINNTITREDIKQMIKAESPFYISKKKAHTILYFYNIYLRSNYYKMMDDTSKKFYKLAEQHKIPNKYKKQWWNECENDFMKGLIYLQDRTEMSLSYFMKSRVIIGLYFDSHLRCIDYLWNIYMKNSFQKRFNFLIEKIMNYESSSNMW